MKALFLTHNFPRTAGDAPGSFVLRLARALRGEGVEVRVVAPAAPGVAAEDCFDGIVVERFRYAPRRYETLAYTGTMASDVSESLSAKLALLGLLGAEFRSAVRSRREFQPDLVHAHWWFPSGLVGSWTSALGGVPLVTTLHGSDVRLARQAAVARVPFRRVVAASALLTTVSRWLADEARQIDAAADPMVAPMPVATELFSPGGARSPDQLLFVGRLNAQKGVADLLRALASLPASVTLDAVGDGPDAAMLRALASELGVAERVRWVGALCQPALAALYQRAAALVVPSTDEGLGLVAVEAMLCETPVIAYASGGLPDVVHHERTGLLVPPGDVDALGTAIRDLLGRADRGAALGQAGRLFALGNFAPESVARRYATLYRSALERRAA
ncbi:MAG TPA: glycosyltransferase [Gemmatimonadaceae bacterium]|nr:glycosyltransferase [Gemmatimonadaceae bacterium]